MSTPVAETKPAEEQVLKQEVKEEASTTASEEVQMKDVEKKEATTEPSTAAESSTTTEPSTKAEPTTAMEVDSSQTEAKTEASSGQEPKPEVKANGTTSETKAKNESLRLNGAARKRFRWLLDQGYTREEAAKLAKEPLKTKELRDRFNADTKKGGSTNKTESKVDEELKNLSGAAKKRFRWLLRNGYTEKEAIKMAREPMNAVTSKRNMSMNDGPPSKVSRPTLEVAGGIVMVVAARDYPTTSLTHAQTNEVKSAILKEVVQQKDSELKPRFESCVHVKGYLRVHCSDQETRQWLQRVVSKLTVPEGIKLKVASEKNLLKGDIYTGFFTDSRKDTNEAILEFVESQNDGINTSKWKILTRKEMQKGQLVELMFTVDQASSKSIQNLGCELNYKFNKIKVRKQIKPTEKTTPEVANNNVRINRSMAPPQRDRRTFNQPRPISSGSYVPIWDSNLPQKRTVNNFNQFDSSRNSFSSGSGNGWSNGGNSFGLGGGGSGSFGMNNGGNNSFGSSNSGGNSGRSMGSNSRSNSFGNSNSRSNSFGGSNSRSNSFGGRSNNNGMGGGRGGNQSNSNRPFDLVDSLYDQLKLIGSVGSNKSSNNSNSYGGSSRRSGGNSGGGSNLWGRNTSSNSSYTGRSNSSLGNRNFFTTTRSGFF